MDGRVLALASASAWVASALSSITAPMNSEKSADTSPIASDCTVETKSSPIRSQTDLAIYARDAAEHFWPWRSEEHTSELQSRPHLVCRLLLEKKKKNAFSTSPRKNNTKQKRTT